MALHLCGGRLTNGYVDSLQHHVPPEMLCFTGTSRQSIWSIKTLNKHKINYFIFALVVNSCLFSVCAGQSRQVHLTSKWVFQLVNNSLSFPRADRFCRNEFSSLATIDQLEDRQGALELIQQTGLHSLVWVRNTNKDTSTPVALSKQCE